MKITKAMVHEELRSSFRVLSIFTWLSKFTWFLKLNIAVMKWLYKGKDIPGLDCGEHHVPSSTGGGVIRARIYKPLGQDGPLPAVVYIHGGGYLLGLPEANRPVIEKFIETRPCVVIAPDYRKAYTKPFPAGFDDCYDTLLWVKDNAEALGVDNNSIIVAGHSAGGGLTAAVTLKARDTGDVDIAFQMPIYPMIDDLQPSDPARDIQVPVWDTDMNRKGWGAYLADLHGAGEEIPPYAAAARATDYRGLPPTITFVGTLEPFYWETAAYANALGEAGVEVAYSEYEGCFHAFDLLGESRVGADALRFTFDNFAAFYDKLVHRV